jgi:hypothetical protein
MGWMCGLRRLTLVTVTGAKDDLTAIYRIMQRLLVAVEEELPLKIFTRRRGGLQHVSAFAGQLAQQFLFVFTWKFRNNHGAGRR